MVNDIILPFTPLINQIFFIEIPASQHCRVIVTTTGGIPTNYLHNDAQPSIGADEDDDTNLDLNFWKLQIYNILSRPSRNKPEKKKISSSKQFTLLIYNVLYTKHIFKKSYKLSINVQTQENTSKYITNLIEKTFSYLIIP